MKYLATTILALSAILATSPARARGGTIDITFDQSQLVNDDPILLFYDGGTTLRGHGPGPDLGVEFSLNARVFTQTNGLTGSFTRPGIMELFSDTLPAGAAISATMDVESGFVSTIAFSYAAIDTAGRLRVFSGPDGTGAVLADVSLPITSPPGGPGNFHTDSVSFSGIGHSVIFDGGNKQLALDDLILTVPEPPAWCLLAIGGGMAGLISHARRTRMPRAGRVGPSS